MLARSRIRAAYEEACRREIEALKPGNVHVFGDGHRMSAEQFLVSARVSSGPLTEPGLSVGQRMLEAVRATKAAIGANTNLGIVLLCGPLARAAETGVDDFRGRLGDVLDALTVDDADSAFQAIVLASPGGLGQSDAHDVRAPATVGLKEAMLAAAGRDRIARQYATCFEDVFETGLPALQAARARDGQSMWAAIGVYMAFLAGFPDSHVARKHGMDTACAIRSEAAAVHDELAGLQGDKARIALLQTFDRSLKARGVNPGTSADLTVATLFVQLLSDLLA
jgi:triphosphoribosyl-dephospho-CoA synthase